MAVNVAYDVKRLNKVYSRRTFTDVLGLGDVDGTDGSTKAKDTADLKVAIGLFNFPIPTAITREKKSWSHNDSVRQEHSIFPVG